MSKTIAERAAIREIVQAISRAETVGKRLRHSLMGRAYTIRNHDADIVELEIIPHLRRALMHLPGATRRPSTELANLRKLNASSNHRQSPSSL